MSKIKKTGFTVFAMVVSFIVLQRGGFIKSGASNNDRDKEVKDYIYEWPVPSSKEISDYYGDTNNGLDIISDEPNTEIVAARAGKVIAAMSTSCIHENNYPEYCCNNGMGNYIKIEHEDGSYALYENLKYGSINVKNGDAVKAGDVIGIMGSSGRSEQKHLHFVICNPKTEFIDVNPGSLKYKYSCELEKKMELIKNDNTWKVVNETGINVRSGPGVDYNKIGFLENNTMFKVNYTENNGKYEWANIDYNGLEGFVVLNYASKVNNTGLWDDVEYCILELVLYGGKSDYTQYEIQKGSILGEYTEPEKEGYEFEGWYTDIEFKNKMNPKDTINNDMKLYAKWKEKSVEGQS